MVHISRKAFRLGKFLQDVNSFRRSQATGPTYLLEVLAYGGWKTGSLRRCIAVTCWLMLGGVLRQCLELKARTVFRIDMLVCLRHNLLVQSAPVCMLSHASVVLQEERAYTTSSSRRFGKPERRGEGERDTIDCCCRTLDPFVCHAS